jgi:hypothetical protein
MKRTTLLVTVGVSVLALLAVVVRKGGGMIVIPNRVRVVVVMVSALALAAGLLTLTLLSKPAQAQAETVTDTDRSTFSALADSCTETVFVHATFNIVAHTTTDANGGFHSTFHLSLTGQGEGLDSGDKYVFNGASNVDRNSPTGADLTFTQTIHSNTIRQGSASATDDVQTSALIHFTINAQGEVTAEVEEFKSECT